MKRSQKTKIVFLDAGTVDYKDLSLKPLAKLGLLESRHFTPPQQIVSALQDAAIAVTNKCRFTRDLLEKLPRLKGIFLTATGTNNIDLEAARQKNIAVANVPGYSTETVTQFTIGFLLALAGNLVKYNQAAHDGTWSRSQFFVCGAFPIREVSGKKLGILGYGAIGRRVAQTARALGMKVLISRIPGRVYAKNDPFKRESFETVIRTCDFLSIHAPLSDLTRDLIDAAVLRKMKPGACVINMARGGIVNEKALRDALVSGHLAGAAADVLTEEPPPKDHVLLGAPNLLLTPHVAWASLEARNRLIHEVSLNVDAFLKGKKRNRVV